MYNPVLRKRPSGGYWLGHTQYPGAFVRSLLNGAWSTPTFLTAAYPDDPAGYYPDAFEMSRDDGEYPAVAWSAFNGSRGVEGVFVIVPTDTGWTLGDELPDDVEGILPTVARDRNGDVW